MMSVNSVLILSSHCLASKETARRVTRVNTEKHAKRQKARDAILDLNVDKNLGTSPMTHDAML